MITLSETKAYTAPSDPAALQAQAAYHALSPLNKSICQACAIAAGNFPQRSGLLKFLLALNLTHKPGYKLTYEAISVVLDSLKKLNLVNYNMEVEPAIQHQATYDALQGSMRYPILQAYGLAPGGAILFQQSSQSDLYRFIRLQIYLLKENDDADAAKLASHSLFSGTISLYFSTSINDPAWLNQLPLVIRLYIFELHFHILWHYNRATADLSGFFSTLGQYAGKPGFERISKLFLKHAVHTADLRLMTQPLLSALNMNDDEDLALHASLLFLQGHHEQARSSFETALKLAKRRTGYRKYFFPNILGIYYLLALFKDHTPQTLQLIQESASIVLDKFDNIYAPAFRYIHSLAFFFTERTHHLNNDPKRLETIKHPACLAFMSLSLFYIDRLSLIKHAAVLRKIFESNRTQLPGIARILAEILSKITPDPTPYNHYLNDTKDLYSLIFTSLTTLKESWEISLDSLEYLFGSGGNAPAKAEAPQQNRRLVWLIDAQKPLVIGALEQKINAKGQWTSGRRVALEKLKMGGADFSYATAQDLRVMNTITSEQVYSWGLRTKEEFSFSQKKAMLALIEHPHIIDEQTNLPIEFIKGSVEVLVQDKQNHFDISLSSTSEAPSTIVKRETDTRFQVIEFTDEHVRLSKILGPSNKLSVPKAAKKRLQSILKGMGMRLPVLSEIDESFVRKEGDPTPHMQLVPLDGGLKLNLLVRPFGAEGPYFRPGQGFQTPQTVIKGKSHRVSRNLSEERQQADRLIDTIEILRLSNTSQEEWIIEEPDEALEVVSDLHNYKDPLHLLWPNGQKLWVSAPIGTKKLTLSLKSDQDWFSLEGNLHIDENRVIDLKKLLELLDGSTTRFVPLGDSQYLALTEHFKRQLRELKAIAENDRGHLWVHPLSSSALNDMMDEVAEVQSDHKWNEVKQRLQNAEKHHPAVPATLQAELRPYQLEGFQWLSRLANWGVGACLADDMGLGKTLQALAAILEHAAQGPTLVVAPTSVCHNWIDESARFAPTLQVTLHANERRPEKIGELGPMQLLITSYGLLHQSIDLLYKVKWQTIILDEAQVIKNHQTKRSQAAMQLNGKRKLILTGTPLENRLSDLWNLFRFINPGLLGSYESFNKRFAEPIEQRKDPAARQALKKLIQPFVLRRLKSQVLSELPPRIEKTIVVPFDKEEQAFYEALRRNALEKLTQMSIKEKKRIYILAEITRLRQACCHPALVAAEVELSSTKLKTFMALADELIENKHRALVFSQFVGCLEKVRSLLDEKKISYQYLDGSTPIDERQKRVTAFQNGEGDLFLISLKAGGTGLNLTAADYVVHLDPWWNPAVEDQASDRAHRIGQTRPVTIYRLIMEGTIEEKMIKLHENKRGLANDLLDGTDISGKLSDDELLAMLT